MRSITQLAVSIFAASLPVTAQAPGDLGRPIAPAAGMIGGVGLGGGTLGVAGQLYLGATTSIGDLFARGVYMTEVHSLSLVCRDCPVDEASSDIGVLYGFRVRAGPNGWLRIAAGPAAVRTILEDCPSLGTCYNEWREAHTTGLAVQLDAVRMRVESNLGIGVSVFGNLNADRSFWGITVSIHG
jgi:hypothetical protein